MNNPIGIVTPIVKVLHALSASALATDLPPRRVEAHRLIESWTAPQSVQPATSHSRPGAKPNCAASTGPTSGPAPAMAEKWWPKRTQRLIGWKLDPSYFVCAGVIRA